LDVGCFHWKEEEGLLPCSNSISKPICLDLATPDEWLDHECACKDS